jgi:hypothetical protein
MPLAAGETFAGFTVLRPLGSGGMGEVYLVDHPRLPRREALIILRAEATLDTEFRQRFNREADLAAALWHPHIVAVHDRGEFEGHLWITMDYVEGTDAAALIRGRYPAGLPEHFAAEIVSAVAEALEYTHERGLLHRDVKPANILLTDADPAAQRRRILLTDFGIARHMDDNSGLTATNMTVGTIAYMAPEQLMGSSLDGRADQYSLAASAFELLTGGRPLRGFQPRVGHQRPSFRRAAEAGPAPTRSGQVGQRHFEGDGEKPRGPVPHVWWLRRRPRRTHRSAAALRRHHDACHAGRDGLCGRADRPGRGGAHRTGAGRGGTACRRVTAGFRSDDGFRCGHKTPKTPLGLDSCGGDCRPAGDRRCGSGRPAHPNGARHVGWDLESESTKRATSTQRASARSGVVGGRLLLNPDQVHPIVGEQLQEVSSANQTIDSSGSFNLPECSGAIYPLESRVYDPTNYEAVRGSLLQPSATGNPFYPRVDQSVAVLPSADRAAQLLADSQRQWQDCAGKELSVSSGNQTMRAMLANVVAKGDFISQDRGVADGASCQHSMGVWSNVVVEADVCAETGIDDESQHVVRHRRERSTALMPPGGGASRNAVRPALFKRFQVRVRTTMRTRWRP